MSEPLVSVCIGTYNRKDYVRECVDSALAQTWPHKEIVVVDDASTDGTRELLHGYGAAIRLIQRETNSGMCPVTRNQAARAARGEPVQGIASVASVFISRIDSLLDPRLPPELQGRIAIASARA